MPPSPAREHLDEMVALFQSGLTLQAIGDQFGITRERVRQLLLTRGITAANTGRFTAANDKMAQRMARREARMQASYGISVAEWKAVIDVQRDMLAKGYSVYQTPFYAFRSQRLTATRRGVPWNLTFKQWWDIWLDSGKWSQRGRGFSELYVMCRFGDAGAYEAGNVRIGTNKENRKEYADLIVERKRK